MKRLIDIVASGLGLLVLSPILLPTLFLIWRQDYCSPFYIAPRTGKDGKQFRMVKLRSMVKFADRTGVSSTSSNDSRITPIGHFVRRYKLDEIPQLWNVFLGEMSLVGPRPNVPSETDLYTEEEKGLLKVQPGITDFSSIVFSDEGEILRESKDPDRDYHLLIRPWKSELGLFYIRHQSVLLDLQLIFLTVLSIVSREKALQRLSQILCQLGASADLVEVAQRKRPLEPRIDVEHASYRADDEEVGFSNSKRTLNA